jgi:hypothetical protein
MVGVDRANVPSTKAVPCMSYSSNRSSIRVSNGIPSSIVMATSLPWGFSDLMTVGSTAGGSGNGRA